MTSFSTREACDAAGLTYRQVDRLCRSGLFGPEKIGGSGSRRVFDADDVYLLVLLRHVCDLARSLTGQGPTADLCAAVVDVVVRGDHWGRSSGFLVLAPPLPGTDRPAPYIALGSDLAMPPAGCVLVPLAAVAAEADHAIADLAA